MQRGWHLNFDSAPFCNNGLHIGHVRNYVLGDVRARWLRSHGECCHYRSAMDAFGIPNEAGARKTGVPTDVFVRQNADTISAQMRALRLSYSNQHFLTCDPDYYRWTQWLFLELWHHNLIYSQTRSTAYCERCDIALSAGQAMNQRCWRCDEKVSNKTINAWYVRSSAFDAELRESIDNLSGWSERGRNLLKRASTTGRGRSPSTDLTNDWIVSRAAKWGTPIPAVACTNCGTMPVAAEQLPVRLPEHGGADRKRCSGCNRPMLRVAETLDCFFDDAWCFFGAARDWKPGAQNPFEAWASDPPTTVHFHAGFDTFVYLPLYRIIGRFLFHCKLTPNPEPIDVYQGHDVVTSGGRKMSKSLGNAPDLDQLLQEYGADAVRLGVLVNSNPHKPLEWSTEQIAQGLRFLSRYSQLVDIADTRCGDDACGVSLQSTPVSRLSASLNRFVKEYRIAAALDKLHAETAIIVSQAGTSSLPDEGRASELVFWWRLFLGREFSGSKRIFDDDER